MIQGNGKRDERNRATGTVIKQKRDRQGQRKRGRDIGQINREIETAIEIEKGAETQKESDTGKWKRR